MVRRHPSSTLPSSPIRGEEGGVAKVKTERLLGHHLQVVKCVLGLGPGPGARVVAVTFLGVVRAPLTPQDGSANVKTNFHC